MNILIPVDGSPCSQAAVTEVAGRPWPEGSEIRVLFVVHSTVPMVPDLFLHGLASFYESVADERKLADPILKRAADALREGRGTSELSIDTASVEGLPKEAILAEAESWGADLIVLGSHGRSEAQRVFFGSVARTAVEHAHCSVEIVRCRKHKHDSAPKR